MRPLTLCWLLACAALAPAADPAVRWPKAQAPQPQPAVDRLSAERFFVIDSDVELIILDSPPGRVDKAVEPGPFKVRGKFADGGDAVETRTYRGKFVYFIEVKKGATAGSVELLVSKSPAVKETDFERRTLQVDGVPGPKPNPDVEPNDPLFPPIKAAWGKNKDVAARDKLIKVYKAAAETDLTPFVTAGQLRTALKGKTTENGLAEDDLRPVREAIQVELEQFLPKKADEKLTQDHRANATSTFKRIVTCLEALRP